MLQDDACISSRLATLAQDMGFWTHAPPNLGFLSLLILSQQLSNLAQLAWTNYPPTVTLLLVLGSTIYYSVDTHRIYLVWFA